MYKKHLSLSGLFAIIFGLVLVGSASAVAVKVTPSEIKIEVAPGQSYSKEIFIENPGQDVSLFEVYADGFSGWLSFEPASFILESGDSKKVVLEAKSKEAGIFSTTVSVLARPVAGNGLRMNSGVKIPLELLVVKKAGLFTANISHILNQQVSLKQVFYIIVVFVVLLEVLKKYKKVLRYKKESLIKISRRG